MPLKGAEKSTGVRHSIDVPGVQLADVVAGAYRAARSPSPSKISDEMAKDWQTRLRGGVPASRRPRATGAARARRARCHLEAAAIGRATACSDCRTARRW